MVVVVVMVEEGGHTQVVMRVSSEQDHKLRAAGPGRPEHNIQKDFLDQNLRFNSVRTPSLC